MDRTDQTDRTDQSETPAKIYHRGYGIHVGDLHLLAQSLADGVLAADQLPAHLSPPLHQAVCALAGEIAAARVPLVAIGPDWDLQPPHANYIKPGFVQIDHIRRGRRARLTRRATAAACWIALGLLVGLVLGAWLYRAAYMNTF